MTLRWHARQRGAAWGLAVALMCAPAVNAELLFAVSEGTSGSGSSVGDAQMAAKYKPMIDVMERELGAKIRVRYVRDFRMLEEGMRSRTFDLVLARPSDYPARGLRDYGYSAVTTTRPDGHCLLVVPADSPLRAVSDLKGKRLILPEEVSYMAKFCTAELRDQGAPVDASNTTYVREQGAIPFALKNNLVQVGGIASYSGAAKNLEKDGLRVLHKSRPQPYLPLIAGQKIAPERARQLGQALVTLAATEHGAHELKAIGLSGFDINSQQRLLDLLTWLGDRKN